MIWVKYYLEGEIITSAPPVMNEDEAIKDVEGRALNIGDVIRLPDNSEHQIIYSYSDGYSQSENSTKRQGLSIGVDYKISDASKLNLKYATTTDEKGNNVSRIPKNSISFNGQTILFDKLNISANLQVVRDLEESGVKMKDYNLLNSKLNYQLTDKTQLTLSAENLLNENYETAKGFSTSNRAFYLGYNANF